MRSRFFAAALTVVFSVFSIGPALAAGGLFGNLTGTVVSATNHAPIAGAHVTAKSGSGTYTATTDAKGAFTILQMNVDTYTVSVSASKYMSQDVIGVTVFGDETDSVGTVAMQSQLTTIARVTARSSSSAYQPSQTTDSYTVNQQQIIAATGKQASTNENNVLLSVPGVTLTNAGTVTIRGGAAYEVAYQYDGVTFKEPFLGNNASNGLVNGLGQVQIVEGAGDATQAGVGAGVVNVIPQRGSGPGNGLADVEVGGPNFNHQVSLNYGFSTPNDRFSEYVAYTGQRFNPYLGYSFTPLNEYGNQFASAYETADQFVNNFFYNFGKNNHESLQVLYSNIANAGYQISAGPGGLYDPNSNPNAYAYYPYDGLTQSFWYGVTGYTPDQYAKLIGLSPGVPATNMAITAPQQNFSNNTRFLKFEYDNHLNQTTTFDVRYYNWEELQNTDNSYSLGAWYANTPGVVSQSSTGGPTTGISTDLVHQFGQNLTVSFEGQYNVLHPVWDGYESQYQLLPPLISGLPNQIMPGDWLTGGYFCGGGADFGCSGANGVSNNRIPSWGIGYNGTYFQNWGAGIRFQYDPTDSLKFDVGLRDEGQNQHWFNQLDQYGQGAPSSGFLASCAGPVAQANPTLYGAALSSALGSACPSFVINNPFDVAANSWTNSVLHPTELQPRGSISYRINSYNSLRFGYGRSAVFADAQTAGTPFHLYGLAPYLNVPAKGGSLCGWTATYVFACNTAAQQLYWAGDNVEAPDAGNGTPAIYTNYDLSFNHLFKSGWGMRITPFEKLGSNLPTFFLINPVLGIFGVSNEGLNKTAGVELNVTTPQRGLGINGFISATYQNVLSTTPPFTSAETTVPLVPTASLALGNLYRAGYVSPLDIRIGALDKFKNGWSISPQLEYNIGYPYSVGNTIAAQLANGSFANIPQVNFGPGIVGGLSSFIGTSPGAAVSTNYYDPAYPGSALNPNIAATRGTPATSANGGYLSHPNLLANLSIQHTSGPNTIGIQFLNLFGNAYINSVPAVNPFYQPVANGISGPQTGYNSCYNQVGSARGCSAAIPRDLYAFSNGAYLLSNGNFTASPGYAPLQPFTVLVYFQHSL